MHFISFCSYVGEAAVLSKMDHICEQHTCTAQAKARYIENQTYCIETSTKHMGDNNAA